MGKSQTAIAFAYAMQNEYALICWLNCRSYFRLEIKKLIRHLNEILPAHNFEFKSVNLANYLQAVAQVLWGQSGKKVLLILDDVNDSKIVSQQNLLHKNEYLDLIITANSSVNFNIGKIKKIAITKFDIKHALRYLDQVLGPENISEKGLLSKRRKRKLINVGTGAVKASYFPLALAIRLNLFKYYLRQTKPDNKKIFLEKYLKLYAHFMGIYSQEKTRNKLLKNDDDAVILSCDIKLAMRLFEIFHKHLCSKLLELCFFNPECINKFIFQKYIDQYYAENSNFFDVLIELCFICPVMGEDQYKMHNLVQQGIMGWFFISGNYLENINRLLGFFNDHFIYDHELHNADEVEIYVPHIEYFLKKIKELYEPLNYNGINENALINLINKISAYEFFENRDFKEAMFFLKIFLEEHYPEVNKSALALYKCYLACVQHMDGLYAEAYNTSIEAVGLIRESEWSLENKLYLLILFVRAHLLYEAKKNYSSAERKFKKIISLYEKLYPSECLPGLASAYNSLGNIYLERGNFSQALNNYTCAYIMYKSYFGQRPHLWMTITCRKIAITYLKFDKSNHEIAYKYLEVAKNQMYQLCNPDSNIELALLSLAYGDYAKIRADIKGARSYYLGAIQIYKNFAPKHIGIVDAELKLIELEQQNEDLNYNAIFRHYNAAIKTLSQYKKNPIYLEVLKKKLTFYENAPVEIKKNLKHIIANPEGLINAIDQLCPNDIITNIVNDRHFKAELPAKGKEIFAAYQNQDCRNAVVQLYGKSGQGMVRLVNQIAEKISKQFNKNVVWFFDCQNGQSFKLDLLDLLSNIRSGFPQSELTDIKTFVQSVINLVKEQLREFKKVFVFKCLQSFDISYAINSFSSLKDSTCFVVSDVFLKSLNNSKLIYEIGSSVFNNEEMLVLMMDIIGEPYKEELRHCINSYNYSYSQWMEIAQSFVLACRHSQGSNSELSSLDKFITDMQYDGTLHKQQKIIENSWHIRSGISKLKPEDICFLYALSLLYPFQIPIYLPYYLKVEFEKRIKGFDYTGTLYRLKNNNLLKNMVFSDNSQAEDCYFMSNATQRIIRQRMREGSFDFKVNIDDIFAAVSSALLNILHLQAPESAGFNILQINCDYFFKQLEIERGEKVNPAWIENIFCKLGGLFMHQGSYKTALGYYKKAKKITENSTCAIKAKIIFGYMAALIEVGKSPGAYAMIGELRSYENCFGDIKWESVCELMAFICWSLGKLDEAKSYAEKANNLEIDLNRHREIKIKIWRNLSRIYRALGDHAKYNGGDGDFNKLYQEALKFCNQAETQANVHNDHRLLFSIFLETCLTHIANNGISDNAGALASINKCMNSLQYMPKAHPRVIEMYAIKAIMHTFNGQLKSAKECYLICIKATKGLIFSYNLQISQSTKNLIGELLKIETNEQWTGENCLEACELLVKFYKHLLGAMHPNYFLIYQFYQQLKTVIQRDPQYSNIKLSN